jgi:DNA helicase-2/ATP-dependent DNA helicase PcrA
VHESTRIVLGPPGTGKTTTLVGLVEEELARGTPPDRIGYVTFTRRGAQEARDRMAARFGLGRRDLPHFSTIHSLCLRAGEGSSASILGGASLQEFSEVVGERITGRFSQDDGSYSGYDRGDRILFMDNLARVRRIPLRQQYEESHDDVDWVVVERFSRALEQFKRDRHLLDYTDLLEDFVATGRHLDLEVLFVDEAQDLSRVQWDVVRLLGESCRVVWVAGDDDQAIYRWAGADVDTFLDLEGEVRVLGQSWRVPRAVQRVADRVIGRVRRRRPKLWAPRPEEGLVASISDIADADWTGDSVMVLARNQYLLRGVMAELRAAGVLYTHHGHPSVSQRLLDAIVCWERLRSGQEQPVEAVRRMLDLVPSGPEGIPRGGKVRLTGRTEGATIGMAELRRTTGLVRDDIWHQALGKIPPEERAYMVRCRRQGEMFSRPPRVRVDTIHASKGGEADRVVLLTEVAQRTLQEAHDWPDDEARTFYVGVTRARRDLQVVSSRSRLYYDLW